MFPRSGVQSVSSLHAIVIHRARAVRPDAVGETLMQSHLPRKDLTLTQPLGPLVVAGTNPRYFAIAPAPGEYAVEWHSLVSGETVSAARLTAPDTKIRISNPSEIAGPAMLHLRRVQS
jgi:hypothetical protein